MKKIDKEPEDNLIVNRTQDKVQTINIKSVNVDSDDESDDSDSSEGSKHVPQRNIISKIKKPIVESESESDSD
jgi:hypothetical protein